MKPLKLLIFIFFSYVINVSASYSQAVILKELNGQPIAFNSLKGKWVFINYWASWCPSCLGEIATLNQFYHQQNKKIALFAVNYDSLPISEQLQLLKKYHIDYPNLQEDPGKDLNLESPVGLPATFVFNPRGELATILYGEQSLENLKAQLIN